MTICFHKSYIVLRRNTMKRRTNEEIKKANVIIGNEERKNTELMITKIKSIIEDDDCSYSKIDVIYYEITMYYSDRKKFREMINHGVLK